MVAKPLPARRAAMAALDQAFALLHSEDPGSEAKLERMLQLARARRPRGRKVGAAAGGKASRMGGAGLKPPASSSSSSASASTDGPPPAKRARTVALSAAAAPGPPGTASASQAQAKAKDGAKPPLAPLGRRAAARGGGGGGGAKSKPALVTLGRSKGKRK